MYILFTVHVVFVGRLVCSVNVLYMELSYTGSLDRSTRASELVTVQISYACKTTAGFIKGAVPMETTFFKKFEFVSLCSFICCRLCINFQDLYQGYLEWLPFVFCFLVHFTLCD